MKQTTFTYGWEDNCLIQLNDISIFANQFNQMVPKNVEPLENLEDIFANLSRKINNNNLDIYINNEYVYFYIASYAIAMIKNLKLDIDMNTIHSVLIRKQKDYGPMNIMEFGSLGIIIRMFDKVARLRNLTSKGLDLLTANDVPNETFLDTLIDIIGYCTIGLMIEEFDEEYGCKFLTPLS